MFELLFVAILGAVFGSFINVLIVRVPKGESILFPPSSCPTCGAKIPFYLNIPIVSYLILRGRSKCCASPISPLYIVSEIVVSIIFIGVYLKSGANIDFLRVAVVFALLYALAVIDMREFAIPDSISLSASLIALLSTNIDVIESFLLLAGAGTMLRFFVSFFAKKEVMGEGDTIIFAILGALLGFRGALYAIFLSSLMALPLFFLLGRKARLPFVPFLALSGFIIFLFAGDINAILEGIYGR